MNKQIKSLRDEAVKSAQNKKATYAQQEAFRSYQKMADYLDKNFPPVEAKPQTAASPILENGAVWGACLDEKFIS